MTRWDRHIDASDVGQMLVFCHDAHRHPCPRKGRWFNRLTGCCSQAVGCFAALLGSRRAAFWTGFGGFDSHPLSKSRPSTRSDFQDMECGVLKALEVSLSRATSDLEVVTCCTLHLFSMLCLLQGEQGPHQMGSFAMIRV